MNLIENGVLIMRVVFNNFLPFKGFVAINLFGLLLVRGERRELSSELINHERIHTAQMRELGYLFFYILYVIEWVFRLFLKGNAYRMLSFECEAYENERDLEYLKRRRRFAMWRRR